MEDRELLRKLNNLKNIKPDNKWKQDYQDVLYSQISASRPALAPKSNIGIVWESIMPRQIIMNLAKPVWVTLLASILILVVGIGGVYASKNSKPGDSLYIAKIISEKAQFAITFDEKDKAKLGVEFAANRAKEMIQVLEDTGQTAITNNDKLEKLSQNFKKEISQVKNRLTIIKQTANDKAKNDESEVFGANLGKSNQRMEIAESIQATSSPRISTSTSIIENQVPVVATSTVEIINQTDKMLEQAEKLFDENKLDETINALEEASRAIGDNGQVKGVSETASSTE